MKHNNIFDTIIIGNGSLGLSLAVSLASKKQRVALVGLPHRPWSASAAAGAMHGCFGEATDLIVGTEGGRIKLDMAYRARGLWDSWLDLCVDTQMKSKIRVANGTMMILNTIGMSEVDDSHWSAFQSAAKLYNEPMEVVDPRDIPWLDPTDHARPLQAIFLPNEHAFDATLLLDSMQTTFIKMGGIVVPELATSIQRPVGDGRIVYLESGDKLEAGHIVLAAGALTWELLKTVPDIACKVPPLCSGVGISALLETADTEAPPYVIRSPNRAFACGLHMVPRAKHEVYLGATNIIEPVPETMPVLEDLTFLLKCGSTQLRRSLSESRIVKFQVGNRPVSFDGYPLIGPTSDPHLWLMTGTYRDGFHLSPLLARAMSAMIMGDEATDDLSLFYPERSPVQTLSRKSVVEMAAHHMQATGYEMQWSIPNQWTGFIDRHLKRQYQEAADNLSPKFTPPPEILAKSTVNAILRQNLKDFYARYEKV